MTDSGPCPLIARDLPRLPNIHGLERDEAYFASRGEFRDWFERNGVPRVFPDWADRVFPAHLCRLTAHFRAETWVRDYAMGVDSQGADSWTVMAHDLIIHNSDLDFLRDSTNAPRWVREWSGPFTITLEIDHFPAPSHHHRMRIHALLHDSAGNA